VHKIMYIFHAAIAVASVREMMYNQCMEIEEEEEEEEEAEAEEDWEEDGEEEEEEEAEEESSSPNRG
jgi:hypothetical protein